MKRVAVLLLLLTACAQKPWTKDDFTQQQFNKDKYECQRDANMAGAGYASDGFVQASVVMNTREQCMIARGYHRME